MNVLVILAGLMILLAIVIFVFGINKVGAKKVASVLFCIVGIVLIILGCCLVPASMWRDIGIAMLAIGSVMEVIAGILHVTSLKM